MEQNGHLKKFNLCGYSPIGRRQMAQTHYSENSNFSIHTTETMLTCTFKRTPQIGSNVHFAPMDKLAKLVAFQAAGVSSILTGSAIAGEWNGYINHTALITQR